MNRLLSLSESRSPLSAKKQTELKHKMKPTIGKIEAKEMGKSKANQLFRTTGWRPVSFFGEGLAKRKARRVYEGRGGFPSSNVSSNKPAGTTTSHC